MKVTFVPSSFSKVGITDLRVCLSTLLPSGLPKCEAKTIPLGFYSKIFLIVGTAA